MKKFISLSGGVESSTMCVLFGDKADAIFSDTEFEHKEIYDRLDKVEQFVKENIRSDFKVHRIKHEKYSLPEYIKESKFYPSFMSRFCTRMFKIETIDRFLNKYKESGCELMIGLNADERDNRTGNHGNKKFIKYSYPLVDKNLNRAQCENILQTINLYPEFPVYMRRGGCIGCYYKSDNEFMAMALLNPTEFKIVEDLENEIQDKRDKFFSIKQKMSMKELREKAESMMFTPEEMYSAINNVTQCGVFCNR